MNTFENHLPLIYTFDMPNETYINDEIQKVEQHLKKLKKMRVLANLSEIIVKHNIDARFTFHKLRDSVGILNHSDVHLDCEFSYSLNEKNSQLIVKLENFLKENMFNLFMPYIEFKKCYILNQSTMNQFCEKFVSHDEAIQITQGFIQTEKNKLENSVIDVKNETKVIKL
jgi:hypothetical protein